LGSIPEFGYRSADQEAPHQKARLPLAGLQTLLTENGSLLCIRRNGPQSPTRNADRHVDAEIEPAILLGLSFDSEIGVAAIIWEI
jgi:hypothetical protein